MTTSFARFIHELVKEGEWLSLFVIAIFVLIVFGGLGNGIVKTVSLLNDGKKVDVLEASNASISSLAQSQQPVLNRVTDASVAGASIDTDYIFNELDWDLNNSVVKEKDTGFYCVRDRKNFDGGEIWYREKIHVGEIIKIRFSLKTDKGTNDNIQSPKLITLYGRKEDKSAYYRMFFPDIDTNFIGFEDASSKRKNTPNHLLRPLDVLDAKEIELEYSVESSHSNEASFQYKLFYVPVSDDVKQVTDEGSFQSSFPWPNAKNVEQEFGIGAYKGTCFKIISFSKSRSE